MGQKCEARRLEGKVGRCASVAGGAGRRNAGKGVVGAHHARRSEGISSVRVALFGAPAAQEVAVPLLASGTDNTASRRAHEGRHCGAAEIQRIAENAPGWPDMNT
jgi:hypothetical protein